MLTELLPVVVAAAAGTPLAGLVGWLVSRKQRDASYAQIVSDMSRQVAQDLREDNKELEEKLDRADLRAERLEASMALLRDRVAELSEVLRIAITRLEAHGVPAADVKAVLHGRTNGVGH